MAEPIVHAATAAHFARLVEERPQAIVLFGAPGVGKDTLTNILLRRLLGVDALSSAHPIHYVGIDTDTSLSIEAVRDAQHFLSRKGDRSVGRYIVIARAGRLGHEAQNALLKTLEEPPEASTIILTAATRSDLLPTILSRVQSVDIRLPSAEDLKAHFIEQGHSEADVNRALLMSGGLPGLTHAMLTDEGEHPLLGAATTARDILRHDTFMRLTMVDTLSKQRSNMNNVLFMLSQMARLSLADTKKSTASQKQWRTVLREATRAEQALTTGAQAKLVATDFMLCL